MMDDGARVDLEIEMERHQPILSMKDGSIRGCQCMDRVFHREHESWGSHLADVALAAVLSALSVEGQTLRTVEVERNKAQASIAEALAKIRKTPTDGMIGLRDLLSRGVM